MFKISRHRSPRNLFGLAGILLSCLALGLMIYPTEAWAGKKRSSKIILIEVIFYLGHHQGSNGLTSEGVKKFFYVADQRAQTLTSLGSDESQINFSQFSRKVIFEDNLILVYPITVTPPTVNMTNVAHDMTYETINQVLGRKPLETRIPFGTKIISLEDYGSTTIVTSDPNNCDDCPE